MDKLISEMLDHLDPKTIDAILNDLHHARQIKWSRSEFAPSIKLKSLDAEIYVYMVREHSNYRRK